MEGKLPCKLPTRECLTSQVLVHRQETREIQTESSLLLPISCSTWHLEKIHFDLLQRDKLGSVSGIVMKVDFGSR